MKKNLIKVSFLTMMLSCLPIAMTSCKDYDDDITEINGTTDLLSSQIAAINTAIESNKAVAEAAQKAADASLKAAQAAQSTGDQAEADAQKAMAVAKAAEAAAAQAKADALAQIKLEAESLSKAISGNSSAIAGNAQAIKENSEAISALLGRVNGVEKGLADLDIEGINSKIVELNTALEAVNTQLKALAGYETRLKQLESQYSGIASEVAEAKQNIASIKSELSALQTKINKIVADVSANAAAINTNANAIAALRTDLANLSAEISTKVQNGINTIAGVISARLTSVTLMPSLYVGGLPTIEFESAQYQAMQWQNGQWVANGTTYRVSNNETEIEYRMNPSTVQTSDINVNGMAFVSRIATTRAGEVDNDIINVVSGEVSSNGVLKIKAGKSNTNSLNLSGNKIYTVSLKVPIAKQHLFDGEGNACVYSEYTRLAETYFQPRLHKTAAVANSIPIHLNDSVQVYESKMGQLVAAKVQYNKTLDLNTLVDACKFTDTSDQVMTREQMAKYGFAIDFTIATKAYTTDSEDKSNQQSFAKLNGSILTPGAPTTTGFSEGNQTAIGKQPIIHIWLKDTKNNKVVDSRYIKILFTREDPTPLAYTITPAKTANMGCQDYSWSVTWDEMTKFVLSQFPNNGISKEDFFNRYGAHASQIEVKVNGTPNSELANNVTDNVSLDNTGASIPVMTFTLDNVELGTLAQGATKTYTITLTYTDKNDLNPAVSVTFTCQVTNNIATPQLGRTDAVKWKNEQMLMYPIPYGSANASKNAEYNTNILEGRYNPLATGMISCAMWELAFDKNYPGVTAALGGWRDISYLNSLNTLNVGIQHNTQGIQLVSNETALTLNWNVRLNGIAGNEKKFGTSVLKIVKPLKDPEIDNSVVLKDQSYAQTVALGDKFTLRDAYGNIVANTSGMAKNLWDYYGVTEVIFANAAGQIKITDDINGTNPRTLTQLNMSANVDVATQQLTFQANGAPIQKDCYLQIPVQVKHYWGTLEGKLYVKIQHTL